jgi:hypothetical protein
VKEEEEEEDLSGPAVDGGKGEVTAEVISQAAATPIAAAIVGAVAAGTRRRLFPLRLLQIGIVLLAL